MSQELRSEVLDGGITLLQINNDAASASISLFGAQVLSYVPAQDGRERLFLSKQARLDGSKSIRGGIPLCWPWFGAHRETGSLPLHGYIRTRHWHLVGTEQSPTLTRLILQPEDSGGPGFAGNAELELRLEIGATLRLELSTRNTGDSPFPLSCALHSYFRVSDIDAVRLEGLQGSYSDKNLDWAIGETPAPYAFRKATDRIHLDAPATLQLQDGNLSTAIGSEGHDSIVVWNPWREGAALLPDMNPEEYRQMLCVETALTRGFMLAPGQRHVLQQQID